MVRLRLAPRAPRLRAPVEARFQRSKGSAIARDLRVNQMIRIPQVRVVDEEGAQLGVMPTPQALAMAQERGLDLVEVAPLAAPPVVKFLDFGQYKYELTKREKENKRRQRSVTFKEVRLSPKIGSGDFETKVHRAIEFLEDGDRIKVTVRFRGRELTHPELGRNMLAKFTERIKDHGVAERAPLLEGKSMHLTVASLHKPKEHEPQQRAQRGSDGAGDTPPAAEAQVAEKPVAAKPAAAEEPVAAKEVPAAAEEPVAAKEAPAAAAAAAATSEPTAKPVTPTSGDEGKTAAAKPATNGPAADAPPATAPSASVGEAASPKAPAAKAAPAKAAPAKASPAAKPAEPQANTNGPVRPAARSSDTSAPQAPAATGE